MLGMLAADYSPVESEDLTDSDASTDSETLIRTDLLGGWLIFLKI